MIWTGLEAAPGRGTNIGIFCNHLVLLNRCLLCCKLQVDNGSGMKQDATVDDLVKIVEDLTRIHWLLTGYVFQLIPWNKSVCWKAQWKQVWFHLGDVRQHISHEDKYQQDGCVVGLLWMGDGLLLVQCNDQQIMCRHSAAEGLFYRPALYADLDEEKI